MNNIIFGGLLKLVSSPNILHLFVKRKSNSSYQKPSQALTKANAISL